MNSSNNASQQSNNESNGLPSSQKARFSFLFRLISSRRWLIVPPIMFGVLVIVLMVISQREIPRIEISEQSVKVIVVEAIPESIKTKVVGYGTAEPSRSWTAISEVGGRVETIHPSLESGNWIRAGETLIRSMRKIIG